MKRNYVQPFAKFILFKEDVITTSVLTDGDDNLVMWPKQAREVGSWN